MQSLFKLIFLLSCFSCFSILSAQNVYAVFENTDEFKLSDDADLFGNLNNRLAYFEIIDGSQKLGVSGATDTGTFQISSSLPTDLCSDFMVDTVILSQDYGGGEGSAIFQVSGGTPPYSYWIDGASEPTIDSIFTGLYEGMYFVMITDANDCVIDYSFIIDGIIIGGVLDNKKLSEFSLSPNPTPSNSLLHLNIEFLQSFRNVEYHLFDFKGQKMRQEQFDVNSGKFQKTIPISDLSKGNYVFSITIEGEIVAVETIVVQ